MPDSWSKTDEERYQHIKHSELSRGLSQTEAERIAAMTVNKTRREEGRTEKPPK
jgi:hypothetical protein